MSRPSMACLCAAMVLSAQDARLAEAVRAARYPEALKLIAQGADPNQPDSRGNTPLMYAAAWGQIPVAKALLDNQALINAHPYGRPDALHLAAQNRQTAMIDLLLTRGADPGTSADWPPLDNAYRDKLIRIGVIVARVAEGIPGGPPDSRQSVLNAALCRAARRGDTPLVQRLLDLKANPVSDDNGVTSLQSAAERDHAEVVKLLMSTGIRKELVREAVRAAGPNITPALRNALGETAAERAAIASALQAGDASALKKLIDSGAYEYWAAQDPTLRTLQQQARERGGPIIWLLYGASRQSETLPQVLERMLSACRERPSAGCAKIADTASWYLKRLGDPQWKANYSPDYFRSLQTMANILQTNPEPQTVNDIADDLQARREYCVGNRVGMGGSVMVQVHTRNRQQEVPNWQVYYLLKIFEHNPGATPGAFLTFSSPASESIEPGRYWLWARDPASNRTTERKLVSLNGAQTVAVDLFVP